MQDNRKGAGRFDRRVAFVKPTTVTNDFNEAETVFIDFLSGVPAAKTSGSGGDENLNGHNLQSTDTVTWETRYMFGKDVKANWKIRDLHDGLEYELVAPPKELQRRDFIQFKTRLLQ